MKTFIPKIELEEGSINGCIFVGDAMIFTIDGGTIPPKDLLKISRIQATKSVRKEDQLIELQCKFDDYKLEEIWNSSHCLEMNLNCTILEGDESFSGYINLHKIIPRNLSLESITTLCFYLSNDAENTKIVKLE